MSSEEGWVGVDLDGTLAEYHGWDGGKIGPPIPAMVERVKQWIANGVRVKIFTARVGPPQFSTAVNRPVDPKSWPKDLLAGSSGVSYGYTDEQMIRIGEIRQWCREHIGHDLEVTSCKDMAMLELWDDRCVTVEKNTGRILTIRGPLE